MDWRIKIISAVVLLSLSIFLLFPAFPQPLEYHSFIDVKTWMTVPNFGNVASNFLFLVFGIWGLWIVKKNPTKVSRAAWLIFFFGVLLTAFGSGYYHWNPSNTTLVWDRLPMTIAFMSLISLIVTEVIDINWGRKLLIPLLIIGFSSVAYWHYTEQQGVGDLRAYGLVQFVPLILIPFILLSYPVSKNLKKGIWFLFLFYILAKISEAMDLQLSDYFIMSGHSLKHLLAALGIYFMLAPAKQVETEI